MNKIGQINEHYRHVIVGDGLTAAAFLDTCQLNQGDELIIIGKQAKNFGRGIAYVQENGADPWSYAYLLNSPAIDIDPDFAGWLTDNWEKLSARMKGRKPDWLGTANRFLKDNTIESLNVPRVFFGDFMEEQIQKKFADLRNKGITLTFITACAIDIEENGSKLIVKMDDGQTLTVDSVDIAPGGPNNQRFSGDDSSFSAPSLFGYEGKIAEHIQKGSEIFCIGTNATMLDALRLCQSLLPDEKVKFATCSPSGMPPPPLIPRASHELTKPSLSKGHENAQSFLENVQEALQKAQEGGDEMREIRAGFRGYFIEHGLHEFLEDDTEARKVPAKLRHWLRGGTRDTIQDFHQLVTTGNCRIFEGSVHAIEALDDGARVVIRDKEQNERTYDTGFVINCAGPNHKDNFDPLTDQMLKQGHLKFCAISGGIEVGKQCQTGLQKVRYLSPAVTIIGKEVMPMPLYDAHLLRTWVHRSGNKTASNTPTAL